MTLIEAGTPEEILTEDPYLPDIEANLWSEPTTSVSSQQTARQLLFYPDLIRIVGNMADAHVSKIGKHRTDAEIVSEHEQAMSGIMDVIYRGGISDLPADFAADADAHIHRQHHFTGRDYDS